jgi:hypothetical protein
VGFWPPRLIEGRHVSYLVYYTDVGDDPPEAPIVESDQQQKFRDFIETYGGQLVHTVRRNHEGRAWIYRISKLLAQPKLSYARRGNNVVVTGEGFRFNSHVKLYYHRVPRGSFPTDSNGSLSATFPLPNRLHPRYWLVAIDDSGSVAAGTGLTGSGAVARSTPTRAAPGSSPDKRSGTQGPPPVGPLNVGLTVARQVPVGSQLPVIVHVQKGASRSTLVARANVSLVIRSRAGSRVSSIRLKERQTNQLGDAYFNLAALELPGHYSLSVSVEKGPLRGGASASVKVRRR